jgi:hypothetical protein
MAAAIFDFTIEQGATLNKIFLWKDNLGAVINLTGYTARMQARPSLTSTTIYLDMTNANGQIVITAGTGSIQLLLSAATTNAIEWTKAKYDLEVVSGGGAVTRLIYGSIDVSRGITR